MTDPVAGKHHSDQEEADIDFYRDSRDLHLDKPPPAIFSQTFEKLNFVSPCLPGCFVDGNNYLRGNAGKPSCPSIPIQ